METSVVVRCRVRARAYGVSFYRCARGRSTTRQSACQLTGRDGRVRGLTDVFALGAIVYRALTGKHAFPSRSTAGAVYEALHHHPPPASSLCPELPEDVDDVLALALAKRPADRYARPSQLADDLRLAASGSLGATTRQRARTLALGPDDNETRRIIHPALHN